MLLLNVRRCGFIFPTDKIDAALPGISMYELNIQSGDAMDASVREYTQWVVDMNQNEHDKFAERIMAYVRGINDAMGTGSVDKQMDTLTPEQRHRNM